MKNAKINVKVLHNVTFTRELKHGAYIHNLFVVYDDNANYPYIVMTKTPKGKYYTHESFYKESDAIECMFDMVKSIADFTKNDMIEGK